MPTVLKIYLAILIVWISPHGNSQPSLGPGFTFQGELQQNGVSVDGTVHLRFSLWNAAGSGAPPVGGNQVGASQLVTDIPIADGLFTVILNASEEFSPNAWSGEARWLQIEVCGDSNCQSLTILSPRQPLTPAPQALFALRTAGPWQTSASDVFFIGGNVGIGTDTPGKRLTIAGDAELGAGHGDYRHFRIGGGNSSGFLYGSFPKYGDGIHMGYNYYADASGANRVIQPDGATSRVTLGYGIAAIATGGVGEPPVDRVVVDSVGNVRLGANAQLYAPGGEENLRIVRGIVAADGGILEGSGFDVLHTPEGYYKLTFRPPFTSPPAITAMAHHPDDFGYGVMTNGAGTNEAVLITYTISGSGATLVSNTFHFIAIGPR